MTDMSSIFVGLEILALVIGLGLAAGWDARSREVPDRLWQIVGLIGAAVGASLVAGSGLGPVLLWLLVAGFALQHLFPWDERWGGGSSRWPELFEVFLYVGTGVVLLAAGWAYGLGASGVPVAAIAVYAAVLLARGLFEVRVLYGGADAKALITVAVLLPLWSTPLLAQTTTLTALLQVTPFALTALINGAVLALAVPIWLAIRNARRGEFSFARGFLGTSIPTDELSLRFVWLHEPKLEGRAPPMELDTAAEDHQLRIEQGAELRARGIARVWVTPQIPLVLFFALGAGLALLLGNVLLDLAALL
ncbi:membrane protein [mine drainage metagenome]|uniref:Membrane protein n=1 Tax=mine drainage metagenome TaxID=410659 RepID=T0ZLD1_9ZZZZ